MSSTQGRSPGHTIPALRRAIARGEPLAMLPALTVAAAWWGSDAVLLVVSALFPVILLLQRRLGVRASDHAGPRDGVSGLPLRAALVAHLGAVLADARYSGNTTACAVLAIDDLDERAEQWGEAATEMILRQIAERIVAVQRADDLVSRLHGGTFAVALAPVRRATLDTVIDIGERLQKAVAEPISLDAVTVYVTASVGLCPAGRVAAATGTAMLAAAEAACAEALRGGPAAVRIFSRETPEIGVGQHPPEAELRAALEDGAIRPWFQPQLSTDTGAVTGFEALARWSHPSRGVLAPAEFLPALEAAGLMERLGEVILRYALGAMRGWAKAGFEVPSVAVNFSTAELKDPKLVEKITWEMDRFDFAPSRLRVEILETVFTDTDDDVITRNIRAMAQHGFGIDLDDFGTGHASIANIRRFCVQRIKIDRSFVARVDSDPEQQRMMAAILSLAERLEIETLAEGIETLGEHAMLAQLGCGHVQGFGIARPMPVEETVPWLDRHRAKLGTPPRLGRRTG